MKGHRIVVALKPDDQSVVSVIYGFCPTAADTLTPKNREPGLRATSHRASQGLSLRACECMWVSVHMQVSIW